MNHPSSASNPLTGLTIGIDFGTSGARAIAIDPSGQICAQSREQYSDGDDWAATWKQTLFRLLEAIPLSQRQTTQAIALNGTSSTVLLCDGNGQPLTAPLLYHDGRGIQELERLRSFFAHPSRLQAACQDTVLNATSSLVKLLWWQSQPEFAQARYLLHQADWLGWLLHGHLGISDYHNSLKLGYDVARLQYPDWMDELGVQELLPRVVPPGTPIAPVQSAVCDRLGFPSDCLVCAGTTDSIAAFLASGATAPGEAVTSLGSTIVLKLLSETPVENQQYGIYSHRLGDLWLVGGASNTGGAVLQQFFSAAELDSLSQQIAPDRPSPYDYYPLTQPGERFPINDSSLQPRLEPRPDDSVEFLQGLLEGMARIEATGYRLLEQLGATPLQRVYTAGGGAQNAVWTAIRTRYLGVPIQLSSQTEAAYGTAQLAQRAIAQ